MKKPDNTVVDHQCSHQNGCGYCATMLSGLCHSDEAYRTMRKFLIAKNKAIRDLQSKLDARRFVVIEYNWNRVGGVFTDKAEAEKWIDHAHEIQPNLWWEIHEFAENSGLSDDEVEREYSER